MGTRVWSLWLLLSLVLPLWGCEKKPVPKEPIKIGIDIWVGYAYAFIARDKGIFKKNGVDVEIVFMKNPVETSKLYKQRKVQGMFGLFSDMILLNANSIPATWVYTSDYSNTGDVIIAKPRFNSLKELRGKTVGFEGLNSFSHLFVLKVLEKAGLKEQDLMFKNVDGQDVLKALEKNEIDAGHTWDPVKAEALKKGYRALARGGDLPGVIIDGLIMSPDMIKNRPEDMENILRSLIEAKDFMKSNGDEAMEIMAKAEGMTKEVMAAGIRGVYLYGLKENVDTMKKTKDDGALYAAHQTIVDFYLRRGQISKAPEYDRIVEPRFVKKLWEEKGKN